MLRPRRPVVPSSRRRFVGRLDGDFALRLRGNGPDLQGLVDALRFRVEAPVKPSLTTRPLNQPPGQQRNWTVFVGFFGHVTMGKFGVDYGRTMGKWRVNCNYILV